MKLRLGFLYFLLVFSTGFLLGTVRILLLVPRFGVRTAELLETPFMIAVTVIAARWIVRRFHVPSVAPTRLSIGLIGLAFLLIAEFGVAAKLQGQSVREAVMDRDPVSGPVYFLSLGLFALMPMLVFRRKS